jgi:GntR family transcriptional regulator
MKKIKMGVYKEGDLMPTEKALCEEYKVSRVTVRRAIDELLEDGVLFRNFGKSAAVSINKFPRSLNQLNGLQEELEAKGIKCSSYILSHKVIEANEDLAIKMSCNENEELLRIERLRYADGMPLCYQCIYLLNTYCKNLDFTALATASLYKMLKENCNVHLSYATQSINAVLSSYRISALLELETQEPMLKVSRKAYLENEICMEYSDSYYISKRYDLTMTLKG